MCVLAYIYLLPCHSHSFLPSQIDRLWKAATLHRKHHSEYRKPANSKHVIFSTIFLKPLVLADFLTEFYSDPQQAVSCIAERDARGT